MLLNAMLNARQPLFFLVLVCALVAWASDSAGQGTLIDTNFAELPEGSTGGWTNVVPVQNGDSGAAPSTLGVRRLIDGSEAGPPTGAAGGNGAKVLTFDAGAENQFKFQRADFAIAPTLDPQHSVLVVEWDAVSTAATGSTEFFKVQINFEDANGAGVELKNNFNTKTTTGPFGRAPNRLDGIVAAPGAANPDQRRTQANDAFLNHFDGIYNTSIPPSGLFTITTDDTGVLGHLFQQEAVLRAPRGDAGEIGVEWRVVDPFALTVGGSPLWNDFTLTGIGTDNDNDQIADTGFGGFNTAAIRLTRPLLAGESALLTAVTRANENVLVGFGEFPNQDPNGVDSHLKNHQTGISQYRLIEYHAGDLDRDGAVTSDDVLGSGLLGRVNATLVTEPDPRPDAPDGSTVSRGVVWSDGDVNDDARVTVADALRGVLGHVAGAAPSGPRLEYDSGTGAVTLQANGAAVSGFALLADADDPFAAGGFLAPGAAASLTTVSNTELAWINLTASGTPAGANLAGAIDLGAILPIGLSDQDFAGFFADAVFNINDPLSRTSSFFAPDALAGDFNNDGVVDAADYTVWRDGLGAGFTQADYDVWRANYGASRASQSVAAPEPGSALLLAMLIGGRAVARPTRRRGA